VLTFYRLEARSNGALIFREFISEKETEKGYWIVPDYYTNYYQENNYNLAQWKWIPKDSKKRFAYPTKQEAIINYEKRTNKYIQILEEKLKKAKFGLYELNTIKEKLCLQKTKKLIQK